MKARVKSDYRWNTIIAFSGMEYTKKEWRNVPNSSWEEARKHPALEIDEENTEEPKKELPKAEQLLKDIVESEPIEVQDVAQDKRPSRRNR